MNAVLATRRAWVIAMLLSLSGCMADTGDVLLVPSADRTTFETEVMPILAERCANPGCHGEPSRPLEIYAVMRHRLDPADRWTETPLTEMELSRNYANACGFLTDIARAEDSYLLRKTLPPDDATGMHHEGGVIFEDTAEPDYQVLLRWVETRTEGHP